MKHLFPLAIIALALIYIFAGGVKQAESSHLRWLPGLCGQDVRTCPTPVMQKARDRGYVTYAFDAQAAAYPNFKAQAQQVATAGLTAVGLDAREVANGADIILTMPDDATFINVCGSGAAGCIVYWADPIIVYFRKALLYNDWKTTISHEGLNYGHAMGQHERYFDNGEFRCDTTATYSVMSCGTGVWMPQPFDVETVCAVIKMVWCGQAPAQTFPFWNGSRWVFEDGWSFVPNSGCGEWYMPDGRLAWGACASWGGRWNDLVQIWTMPTSTYHPASNTWWSGGLALP